MYKQHMFAGGVFFTLLALLLSSGANAQPPATCTCLWQGAFINITGRADLIVSGTVTGSKGNAFDLAIDNTLLDKGTGQKEFREQIRVWGSDGKHCRPDSSQFAEGSQWLLALKKITAVPDDGFNPNTPNISYGRLNDYYVSGCGVYWLQVQEGLVFGPLAKSERWQWQDRKMNPVRIELVAAFIDGVIPEVALVEAAKPRTEANKLMEQTKNFLRQQ